MSDGRLVERTSSRRSRRVSTSAAAFHSCHQRERCRERHQPVAGEEHGLMGAPPRLAHLCYTGAPYIRRGRHIAFSHEFSQLLKGYRPFGGLTA
eukprot:scaffold1804_cov263-Pinguiococcus_pyrenoidosus.AAC.17